MKSMYVNNVGNNTYKGILMCKSSESSSLTTSEVTLDSGEIINLVDGSVVIEVDTNARHILYDGKWYKKQ